MSTTTVHHDYDNSLTAPLVVTDTTNSILSTTSWNNSWNNSSWTGSAINLPYTLTNPPPATPLKVQGDAEFNGEVTIKGVKLDERLTAIEERLGILRPNNDLEGKWEKLKALGEEYRRMEKEILEGEDIWATLKK